MILPSDPLSGFAKYDPIFRHQMERLHRVTVWARWLLVVGLWTSIAPLSLWELRQEIPLWHDYFTWAAVRYSLADHPLAAIGLALCIGMTVSVLLWQSHNILWGVSDRQTNRLEKQLLRIRQQGKTHPLWKWVCEENTIIR